MVTNPDHDRTKLGVVTDPTVKVQVGEKLRSYLERSNIFGLDVPTVLTVAQLKTLRKAIKDDLKKVHLHQLLEGSEVVIPSLVVPERNPELEKRVTELRNRLANQEYAKMTRNVNLSSRFNPEDTIGAEIKKMNAGLIAVFQFVITVAAAFAFGFMGLEVFVGYSFELPVKLLLGIICALVVAGAELYFLVMNLDLGENEELTLPNQVSSTTRSAVAKKTN